MLDLVISGGRIVDGSGNPWFRADLGIAEGRIAAVGNLAGAPTSAAGCGGRSRDRWRGRVAPPRTS